MSIDIDWLRYTGIALNAIGALTFTIRTTRILQALTLVANAHEINTQQLMPNYKGNIVNFANSTQHLDRAKGTGLLITGLVCVLAGLICHGVATYLATHATSP